MPEPLVDWNPARGTDPLDITERRHPATLTVEIEPGYTITLRVNLYGSRSRLSVGNDDPDSHAIHPDDYLDPTRTRGLIPGPFTATLYGEVDLRAQPGWLTYTTEAADRG